MINHFRIDSKLIHGQLTTKLLVFKRCSRILIIDDDIAADQNLHSIITRVLPSSITAHFRTVNAAVDSLYQVERSENRYLVIVRTPQTALQLLKDGYHFSCPLTCGQLTDDRSVGQPVLPGVNLLPEDIAALTELADSGVAIVFDPKASEEVIPWKKVQKNLKDTSKKESQSNSFASLIRVFRILDLFLEDPENNFTVNEIQGLCQLPFSTTYRLVSFLEKEGYLEKDHATKKEHLGWKFLKLQTESIELRLHQFYAENILTSLNILREFTGEAAAAFAHDGQSMRCISHVESIHSICARFSNEQLLPLQLDGVGRMLVAVTPERDWDHYGVNSVGMHRELQTCREQGYCLYSDDANGSTSISVPVMAKDRVLCILIIQGPSFRFHGDVVDRTIVEMRKIACQLSKEADALL